VCRSMVAKVTYGHVFGSVLSYVGSAWVMLACRRLVTKLKVPSLCCRSGTERWSDAMVLLEIVSHA
jgi:hypothetical protein